MVGIKKNYVPLEIADVAPEAVSEFRKYLITGESAFVLLGPQRYFFTKQYSDDHHRIRDMEVRPDDIWVVTMPRSGTTMAQELIWQLTHDLDFEGPSSKVLMDMKFPFLEFSYLIQPELIEAMARDKPQFASHIRASLIPVVDRLAATPSPRFIKTHTPLSLLPPVLDTAKVVYVARDPRDVALSVYHVNKVFKFYNYGGDFKSYWNLYVKGLVYFTPYFAHVKEAWAQRHHPNMLFMFYEDLVKDMPKSIRRIAAFLDRQVSDEQVSKLAEHLHIDNFRRNPSVNNEYLKEIGFTVPGQDVNFIRKGKSGGWREYFDDEMRQQAEQWIADNLKDTDLRFPS